MGKNFEDLTGMKFGDWQVLYRDTSKRSTYFVCQCKCGNLKTVRGTSLRQGLVTSCGCYRRQLGIDRLRNYNKKRRLLF